MAPELGGSQISALLESVPGIARVLRSPVADAIVNMIRAGAGLEPFQRAAADELIEYAVRRGLINSVEGDQLTAELEGLGARKRSPKPAAKKKPAKKAVKAKSTAHPRLKKTAAKSASKATKKKTSTKKAPKKKPAKKVTKRR